MAIKCTTLQFVFILLIGLSACKPIKDAEYYFSKGIEYTDKNEFKKALEAYNKAIKLEADNSEYYVNRALINLHLAYEENGLNDLKKAYNLDSLDILANFHLAIHYQNNNVDEQAIIYYDRVSRHYPDYYTAYYGSGVSRYEIGDYKGALEQFAKYIGYDINDPWTYYYMGMCSKELGNIKTAIEAFEIAVELGNKEAKEELEKLKEQVNNNP